jgi:hypothetical protein
MGAENKMTPMAVIDEANRRLDKMTPSGTCTPEMVEAFERKVEEMRAKHPDGLALVIDLDLDSIEARMKAKTEGPMELVSPSDFAFLAYARQDVSALVAEVRRLRGLLESATPADEPICKCMGRGSCTNCDNHP